MAGYQKKRQFLNTPKFPGGSEAFKAFIAENVQYPQAALAAGVEGSVVVEYDILDTGEVKNPHILKGLGHGCDEEALRVIGLLQFERVKNRGLRVKMTTKTSINFKLPGGIRFTYTETAAKAPEAPEEQKQVIYEYTVNL
ncbi:MAG: energy transducer TonB [Bacteroidota bacterium]